MTPIIDRTTAFAFVIQHALGPCSAGAISSMPGLAHWILVNRTMMQAGGLPAADAEYRAERAAWRAQGQNLDGFLAPAADAACEDGVSRRVVPELLARKITRLRQSKDGPAALARMLEAVRTAAPAPALWSSGSEAQNDLLSNFFVSVQPHIARVPRYLLQKYRNTWRKLSGSELHEAQAKSFEQTLRSKDLGDQWEPHAVKNFIVMLADSAHAHFADSLQNRQTMEHRIDQSLAGPPFVPRRTPGV